MLPLIVNAVDEELEFIPVEAVAPVVVPLVPARILLAVELPIVLFEIVKEVAAPEACMPITPPPILAVDPNPSNAPILLF